MNCPKCAADMREFAVEDVTVDLCSDCKGLWYDKGELSLQQELEQDIPELGKLLQSDRVTEIQCPRCGEVLREMLYSTKGTLLIDRCPKCEGVFLDRAELKKLEEIVAREESFVARLIRALRSIERKTREIGR